MTSETPDENQFFMKKMNLQAQRIILLKYDDKLLEEVLQDYQLSISRVYEFYYRRLS